MNKGIIVGCDHNQEWMLSWWWENYTCENKLPVVFADFGMTPVARKWCEERGEVITIAPLKVTPKEELAQELVSDWERDFNPTIWQRRAGWFNKPFALLAAPFEQGLWLDVDCEVLGNLEHIFDYIQPISGIALMAEHEQFQIKYQNAGRHLPGEVIYNSGVIAYHRNSALLKKWADNCVLHNHRFVTDQDVLTHLIFTEKHLIGELPEIYNWFIQLGININAKVIHWAGNAKGVIKSHGGFRKMQQELLK